MHPSLTTFVSELRNALEGSAFVSLRLGSYKGKEKGLKSAQIRPVLVAGKRAFSMVLRYGTRDVTKTLAEGDLPSEVQARLGLGLFRDVVLEATSMTLSLYVVTQDKWTLKRAARQGGSAVPLAHNREKARLIPQDMPYLHSLGLADGAGRVLPKSMDKYVQINHFLTLMEAPLAALSGASPRVVDMGAGKGYLTFALYDYCTRVLGKTPVVTGVEMREELVREGNARAAAAGFGGLTFRAGTIAQEREDTDVLVALHACDTATDEAIFHGIRVGASVIVVAPCCHKEVRLGMAKELPAMVAMKTRFGIFREREAEMVTDALRALLLEYAGYTVRVADFVADVHTPKNILITAVKAKKPLTEAERGELWEKAQAFLAYYGIKTQRLVSLLETLAAPKE